MNRYVFEGKNFENCVVFTDDRFGEIRVMVEPEGENIYVGIDIASCMGYAAPGKAIARSGINSKIRMVPWVFKKKQGMANTHCFSEEEARRFIDRGQELPEGFRDWFFQEVVPQARNLKVENVAQEDEAKPDKGMEADGDMIEWESFRAFTGELADTEPSEVNMKEVLRKFDEIVLEMLMLKKDLVEKMNMLNK